MACAFAFISIKKKKVTSDSTKDVWAGPLSDGSFAVLLLNRGNETTAITANWKDFGLDPSKEASVRDLWAHKDLPMAKGSVTANVDKHGVVMFPIISYHTNS